MATSEMQLPKPRLGSIGRMTVQRSVTVPAKLQTTEPKASSVEIGATENIETLYVHPCARIISFTTSSFATPSPIRRSSETGETGSLSWRSPTERTLASGQSREHYSIIQSSSQSQAYSRSIAYPDRSPSYIPAPYFMPFFQDRNAGV